MVRYLEDMYVTGNDIYPNSLPDAYRFLDDWKTHHHNWNKFSRKGEDIALATVDDQEKEGKHDAQFVAPSRENILCWD